jgi:2-polyprenyl-3-methyl-5-hydroxy-6-metoxy-1,4-benzoquinol methylase
VTTCYLCASTAHRERPGRVRDMSALKVLECDACGLVFLSSFDHIHAEHYERSGMHGGQPLPIADWLRESEGDDERRFRFLQSRLPGKRLLDFGCGAGGLLLKARKLAAFVEGIEPEARLQTHFAQEGVNVWARTEDALSAGRRFDLLTAFHVVEHLPDPRRTLAQLVQLLDPGGELIVEVPSSNDALLTLFECEPFRNFSYWSQHLFLFNPHTLADLIRQAGLTLRWIKQVQRYPLSNHLYWLSRGKPGGHQQWAFLDSPVLDETYAARLAALGCCDTLLAGISHN